VPIRWSRPDDSETITVRFRVIPHTGSSAEEPIVAMEGGPGYGSIGSADSYRFMLGPLLRTHDLILMDQRGTGASGAIDCPALQRGAGDYVALSAACARSLGDAATAYGSAAAADDLAAILDGLGASKVDVYGDSYGTYLAQVFALRHPDRTRALILDGAFDDGFDPFARDAAAALRRTWHTLCARAGSCRGILGELSRFSRELERRPLVGRGVDGGGVRRTVRLTAPALTQLVYDGTYSFAIERDLPAALDALAAGDRSPILRLAAEDLVSTGNGSDPRAYSAGAYMAISCHDYPVAWDPDADVSARRTQLREALAGIDPPAFAPFSKDAWLRSIYEEQLVYGCLRWPAPPADDPPAPTRVEHPDLPVLVINGEFDITTPLADAATAASAWPDATLVETENEIHVSALYDFEECASTIVRGFIRTLGTGDTSCAARTPRIHVVQRFPSRLSGAPEAASAAGDGSSAQDRRAAWVVAETVGDALTRWWNVTYAGGAGLRGGTFDVRGAYLSRRPLVVTFHSVRFVEDEAMSGRVVWDRRRGSVRGTLTVDGASGSGRLHLSASTRGPSEPAHLRGTIGDHPLDVTAPPLWSP
jgi:pimeloyl-ACP methyl ester carboxylesterase